ISLGASALAYLLLGEVRKSSDPVSGFFLLRRGLSMEGVVGRGYKVVLYSSCRDRGLSLPCH
ncbi:MAG: glycosyltransferase family 2 protein, partial [Acidilobaceae archaeon]